MSAEASASAALAAWWSIPRASGRRVLFVTHATERTGAPLILLELARRWIETEDVDARILALSGGEVASEFAELAPLLVLDEHVADRQAALEQLRPIVTASPPALAVCNTMQSEPVATMIARLGVPVVALVHEQVHTIELLYSRGALERLIEAAGVVVVPSRFMRDEIVESYGIPAERFLVCPQGSRVRAASRTQPRGAARDAVLAGIFGPCAGAKLVVGCGTVSMRKGFDVFVQVAQRVAVRRGIDARFVWAGEEDATFLSWCLYDARRLGVGAFVRWVGPLKDPSELIGAADVFLLPSREDPFPMVVLEALSLGVPVVAFESAGGAPEAVGDTAGLIVPYLDVDRMSDAVVAVLGDAALRDRLGAGALEAGRRYDFASYTDAVRKIASTWRPRFAT